jgi:hypothetical protein
MPNGKTRGKADGKTGKPDKRVIITSPDVRAYLQRLAAIGIYGRKPGAVATWIVRKEIARLVEAHILNPIEFVGQEEDGGEEEGEEDEEAAP